MVKHGVTWNRMNKLTLSQTGPCFYEAFRKHSGKSRNCPKGTISSFPHSIYTLLENFLQFYQIWNCRLQTLTIWKSLKFLIWKRINFYRHPISSSKQNTFKTTLVKDTMFWCPKTCSFFHIALFVMLNKLVFNVVWSKYDINPFPNDKF